MRKLSGKIIVLLSIIFIYAAFISKIFLKIIPTEYNLIINPLFWIGVAIFSYKINDGDNGRYKAKIDKIQIVFIISLIYLILYFLSGLLMGYSRSPYSHNIIGLLNNFWSFFFIVVFEEYTRATLVRNVNKNKWWFIFITIIFILGELNINEFISNLKTGELAFKYICSIIVPLIAGNALYTYLSKVGSYQTVLAERLPILFANLLLPIFPNLDWFGVAIFNLMLVFFNFITISYIHTLKTERISRRKIKKVNPLKKAPYFIVLILFIAFMSGIFKYYPVSIMSNSMYPLIERGDAVVIEKNIKIDKFKNGDIIEYKLNDHVIVHRIIEVKKRNSGEISFITKGDNNNSPDKKIVKEEQVLGLVKFKIPKIGYPSVWLNDIFTKTDPGVETGKA